MATAAAVKITHGAVDEGPDGEIILRGRIDPASLDALLVDQYQREVLPSSTLNGLVKAFSEGADIPDIILGMRGHKLAEKGGGFTLSDPVYIIDGLQRVSAARELRRQDPESAPYLGATIHFGTDRVWEREQFHILNGSKRVKLSSNILVRNMSETNPAVGMLLRLCSDVEFPLVKRISWQQRMRREEVISGVTFIRTCGLLHSGVIVGVSDGNIDRMCVGLLKVHDAIGRNVFRRNVINFFVVIDTAWGVRNVTWKHGAVHLGSSFLWTLAKFFSDHQDFWNGNALKVSADQVRKLARFPLNDPTIRQIAQSSGAGKQVLMELLIKHYNSGKQKRLQSRAVASKKKVTADDDGEE